MQDSVFTLKSAFAPTGDQPEAIDTLVRGIEEGRRAQTLLGVTGSGKTFTMANVIARCGRPTLILEPNKTLAAQVCSELREFFPDHAVEFFAYRRNDRKIGEIELWSIYSSSIRRRAAATAPKLTAR